MYVCSTIHLDLGLDRVIWRFGFGFGFQFLV